MKQNLDIDALSPEQLLYLTHCWMQQKRKQKVGYPAEENAVDLESDSKRSNPNPAMYCAVFHLNEHRVILMPYQMVTNEQRLNWSSELWIPSRQCAVCIVILLRVDSITATRVWHAAHTSRRS